MNTESQQPSQENNIQNKVAKQQYLAMIFRWINAGCGIALIANGVLRYVFFVALLSEPWTFFQPAYMILFGILIAGSEFNIVFVLSRVSFMHTYIGRGLLDLFVATICSSYLGDDGINILSIFITVSIFIVGLMYLCFHFTGFVLILPQKTQEELDQKKASVNTNNSNSRRHLSDSRDPTSSIYHTQQV